MISTHSLSSDAFLELAGGVGDSSVVRQLRQAQLSKHLMLLHVVAEAAGRVNPGSPATAACGAGYRLLSQVQAADPGAAAALLGLPHIGSWAHDCLARMENGSIPDFGYLATAAAAAAIQVGIGFEINVPVRHGRVPLPGLGCLETVGQGEWTTLGSDGKSLHAGEHVDVACAALVPDDGSTGPVPHWRGTPLIRAMANGKIWQVLLEISDRHLDRYTLPMLTDMTATEVTKWRDLIQAGWELLVCHHPWAAGQVANGVSVIVPLVKQSDLDSATSPAAFGAIATSMPPAAVTMAETLVHEVQHIKLCGLIDMLPLTEPCADRGYAPWREDPRPLGGLLQGVYAFAGIARFWNVQRLIESDPDAILRAGVLYERWQSTIEPVTGALLEAGCLTPAGVRFVTALCERAHRQESGTTSAEAIEIAREVELDSRLTWELRHTALAGPEVARLAAAYRRGDALGAQALPRIWIEKDTRKIDSIPRSRLLHMRYQEPQRYRERSASDLAGLGMADALLVRGDASAAAAAYRADLVAEPDPAAWIGLALAIHRLPAISSRPILAAHLPLLFEMHANLADQGVHADPLDLAAWFE